MEYLLTGIGYLLKWSFKGIGYFLIYTLPLWFCVAAVSLGIISGEAAFDGKYREWELTQRAIHTHEVTIHWDEGLNVTSLQVRDDLNWNICGCDRDNGLYYTKYLNSYSQTSIPSITMPESAKKVGYKFMGLYTSPLGGTQFVNAAGYSIRTVDMDVDLYAVWQEVE